MSNEVELHSAHIIQPHSGKITVLDVTTSSQALNLAATPAEVWNYAAAGRMVSLKVDAGTLWYVFHTATLTLDEDATTGEGADQAYVISAGETHHFFLTAGRSWFIWKGDATANGTYVRMYVSSRNPNHTGSSD